MRRISLTFGILAFGFLGLAAWRHAAERETPGLPLAVVDPDRDLGPMPCKVPAAVRFLMRNSSRQPIQVFGLNPG